MEDIKELELEHERLKRQKENLEKNYERRKRLNLCDEKYEQEINYDLKQLNQDIGFLHRKIKTIESEQTRKKMIHG